MGREQRASGADHLVHQGALGRAGGDGVDATQQQGVVREQQAAVGYVGYDGSGGVDGDSHGFDRFGRVAADQAHRIPVLREPRWVDRVEDVDNLGQLHAHEATRSSRKPLIAADSAIASTRTGQCGRTAARRKSPSKPTNVSQRRTAMPLPSRCFRINWASGTENRTKSAQPSMTSRPMLVNPATIASRSTEVGLVGFPTTTRSASSGTRTPSRLNGGASTTCWNGTRAAASAASGPVNDGAISAPSRGRRLASSAKPSA